METIDKLLIELLIVCIVAVIIIIIITPVNNEPKLELTFDEKKEEAYFNCINKATVNRDSDLLKACDEVLKINK